MRGARWLPRPHEGTLRPEADRGRCDERRPPHRDSEYRTLHNTTILAGFVVGIPALVADDDATYDLTSIGTRFAFAAVCIGALCIREPDRPRAFRVPFAWAVPLEGSSACLVVLHGLPAPAWERIAYRLALGLVIYPFYDYRSSVVRRNQQSLPPDSR